MSGPSGFQEQGGFLPLAKLRANLDVDLRARFLRAVAGLRDGFRLFSLVFPRRPQSNGSQLR